MLVVDASVVAAWLLDDETDPRADTALSLIESDVGVVPQHWQLEVRNVLLIAERRGRMTAAITAERLSVLPTLPIQTDTETDLDTAMDLARTHTLSFYDAVYLELATRNGASVATLDSALARAARAEGLSLIE